jgi:hypothetical protein
MSALGAYTQSKDEDQPERTSTMPRPTSQKQLLEFAQSNYDALQKIITPLSETEMVEAGCVGDWSVKDVLAHLYEWQQMVTRWYAVGKAGENPVTPHEDYTWREIPALNQHIYETYKDHDLSDIQAMLSQSHDDIMSLIATIDDEELFTPKVYTWTKTTTLGSYLTSATSSHYDWARKEIRKGLKTMRQ